MMLLNVCVLWFVIGVAVADMDGHQNRTWDVAVAINDEIELLTNNGSLLPITINTFTDIKALTYHHNTQQFIVGDRMNDNDTIYLFDPRTMDMKPIVEDLPDDIQGIAIDPVSDIVFWTDAINRRINSKLLGEEMTTESYDSLFDFQEQNPQDIAIDSCKRMIYWTNSNIKTPTIEKSTIIGTDRQVLVKDDLYMPSGIAIDQLEQRLYWTDMRQGIYFRIESTDFDGNDRQVLFVGTHQKPFGLAVDKDFVYWTDINNNALWRKAKFSTDDPEIIRHFHGKPNGIVARNVGFPEEPNCDKLLLLIKNKHQTKENEHTMDHSSRRNENKTCPICLHGVLMQDDACMCKCEHGFTGVQCDIDLCYNYCLNGKCQVGNDGHAQCACEHGYSGDRCDQHVCDNYCLNEGTCDYDGKEEPQCTCAKGFDGKRCETLVPVSNYDICQSVCVNSSENIIVRQPQDETSFVCRCSDLSYMTFKSNNVTHYSVSSSMTDDIIKHPVFIFMIAANITTLLLSLVLIGYICKMKRIRPRIKKRVVVNKNVTPLTYRPQSVEQCEITIEDCCNMNICETPCFEPRNFQTKKDEKKTLLTNMENNEEFY